MGRLYWSKLPPPDQNQRLQSSSHDADAERGQRHDTLKAKGAKVDCIFKTPENARLSHDLLAFLMINGMKSRQKHWQTH